MTEFLTYPIRSDKLTTTVKVEAHLAHVETPFQTIDVIETAAFGKMLFLDGHVQLAEFDEFAYHESLVHPAVLSVQGAKRALVVGGGDGAVVRELCRHKGLERIDMVEIDEEVVRVTLAHMPFLNAGTFDDPRVSLHITDAFEFVKQAEPGYDVVVMDSTDAYEEEEDELSARLWTTEFYRDIKRIMQPRGVVVTQADNLVFCPYSLEDVLGSFREVFGNVGSFFGLVPSFGGYSGFAWGSAEGSVASPGGQALSELGLRYLTKEALALGFGPIPFAR